MSILKSLKKWWRRRRDDSAFTPGLYVLKMSPKQFEELESLATGLFDIYEGEPLSRRQWTSLAHMALGKAQLIEEGRYDTPGDDEGNADNEDWSAELRVIAGMILDDFQPGDGRI